jgi:hypothetical protein
LMNSPHWVRNGYKCAHRAADEAKRMPALKEASR